MYLHEINDNILISGGLFLVGYQDKSKNCDLYQEIHFRGSWNQNQKTVELAAIVTNAITKK